jgi:phage terminase small subunit
VDARRGNVWVVLTKKQLAFAWKVAEDVESSGTTCALSVGYSESCAAECASENLRNPQVIQAITERKAQLAAAAGIDVAFVLREWLAIATADPRELTQSRRGCCRYCWGIDNKREWMEHEYATALNEALMSLLLPPAFEGGLGYRPMREPNPDCPRCEGEGLMRTWLADSRELSPQAARLFAGVKQTKEGIEIKTRDQDGALAKIADYLGMSNKSKGELLVAAKAASSDPKEMSDAELNVILERGRLRRARAAAAAAGVSGATLGVDSGVYSQPALPSATIEGT